MRSIRLVLAVAAAIALVGCADTLTAPARPHVAPRPSADYTCRSGYQTSSGYVCTDSVLVQ